MFRGSLCAGLLCLFAVPAFGAPKDCSTAVIPNTPVKGTVAGKPFIPNAVTVQITKNGMQINEVKMDRYVLSIQTDGIFNALGVDAVLSQKKPLAGHVFRQIASDEMGKQPQAADGTPEIQGWDLQLEAAHVDTSFTQDQASLRLEYGARKGNMIPGKIYFCSAATKTEIMGTFTARIPD
ncbi:MAG TPA: hypothetical protein VLV55_12335 [Rhizomicrobium sp.]|nr:hypothetical protein [Rhizomicrobium sp.]